jgi:hypothetical protein
MFSSMVHEDFALIAGGHTDNSGHSVLARRELSDFFTQQAPAAEQPAAARIVLIASPCSLGRDSAVHAVSFLLCPLIGSMAEVLVALAPRWPRTTLSIQELMLNSSLRPGLLPGSAGY